MTLTELLQRYRVPYWEAGQHRHVGTGWIGVDCPYCGPNSKDVHLGFNIEKQFASCWRCGGIWINRALVDLTGESHARIAQLLESLPGRPRSSQDAPKLPTQVIKPPGLEPLSGRFSAYLAGRGFAVPLLAKLWGLQGIGIAGHLSWRIWIPIYWGGELVSWTSRSIGDRPRLRYIAAKPEQESIKHKTILYGGDYVRNSVVVHEGPADAWRMGPGSVATLGTSYSRDQMLWLSRIPRRAICFDAEPAAQRRACQLADELCGFPGETSVIEIESGEDVAVADQAEVDFIRHAFLED